MKKKTVPSVLAIPEIVLKHDDPTGGLPVRRPVVRWQE